MWGGIYVFMDGKTQYHKDIYFPKSNQILRAIFKPKQQSLCVGEGRYFSVSSHIWCKRQILMECNRDPTKETDTGFSVLMYDKWES